MKKFLVLIAVLSLIAGTAYAAAVDEGLARQVWAQSKGRSVVSDGSVLFRVWYTGSSTNPGVGVSSNVVLKLYSDVATPTATTINTGSTSYDTIGEVVDYINGSVTDFHAECGPDGYRAFATSYLLAKNIATPGTNETTAASVYSDASTSKYLLCGVNPDSSKFSRIKSFTHRVAGTGAVTVKVWDGDTTVWRQDILEASYISATANGTSPNTVTFTNTGDKGITGGLGNPLVVEVYRATTLGDTSAKTSEANVSIVYDQF
jgi:hypothetical protein